MTPARTQNRGARECVPRSAGMRLSEVKRELDWNRGSSSLPGPVVTGSGLILWQFNQRKEFQCSQTLTRQFA